MTRLSRARPGRLLAGAVLLLGGLAACSDEPDGPDTAPVSETSDASPSAPSTPSTTAEPTTQPASGPLLEMPAATVNLPEGWAKDADLTSFLATGNGGDVGRTMTLSQLPALDPDVTPQGLERATNKTTFGSQGTVLEPVVVSGVEMRHVQGRVGSTKVEDAFVTLVDGDIVGISVSLSRSVSDAERQTVIEAVLASVVWR